MKTFYHVSKTTINGGVIDFNFSRDYKDWGKYICLSTTKEQMEGWQQRLRIANPHYYVVLVPDNMVVINCEGHYLFEHCGDFVTADKVQPHTNDIDGEVVVLYGTALMQGISGLYTVPAHKFEKNCEKYIELAYRFYRNIKPISKSTIKDSLEKTEKYYIRAVVRQYFANRGKIQAASNLYSNIFNKIQLIKNPIRKHAMRLYLSWQIDKEWNKRI